MLPILLAIVAIVALLPIVAPLLRGHRPVAARSSYDQAVYRDQLNELDREIARGLITSAEADTARLEIQRRLLAADGHADRPASLNRSPIMAAAVVVVALGGAVGGYLWLGAPTLRDMPYAARQQPQPEQAQQEQQPPAGHTADNADQMRQSAAALQAKLKANPNDANGWLLYARTLATMEQWSDAEDAYDHAIALGEKSPAVLADHAETMIMATDGTVTPAAEKALRDLVAADPHSPVGQFYLAVAALQAGEPRKAIDGIQALAADLPSTSPARDRLNEVIANAAKAAGIPAPPLAPGREPTAQEKAEAAAANMTDEQRQTMIRGMVEKLAADLQANPTNVDGWLQLGQSYGVLHEADKAAAAFDKAAALKPGDTSIRLQELQAMVGDLPPNQKLPPAAVAVVRDLRKTLPEEPIVLWFGGLVAVQDGHPDDARQMWQTLLTKIPGGTDDAKLVQTALDSLAKK